MARGDCSGEDLQAFREGITSSPQDWTDSDKDGRPVMTGRDYQEVGVGVAWVDRPLSLYNESRGMYSDVVAMYRRSQNHKRRRDAAGFE